MDPIRLTYLAVFGLAAVACTAAAWRALEVVDDETKIGLVTLLVFSGTWAAASVGRLLPIDPILQKTFYIVGLVFGLATVGAWLYFCSAYTGSDHHRRTGVRVSALVIYLSVVSVKLTNPLHGQYFGAAIREEPFRHLGIELYAMHWTITGLAYALSAVGFYMLYEMFDQSDDDTTGLGALVGVTALPAVLDVLAYTDLGPGLLVKLNYEPIGVAVFAVGALFVVDETFVAAPRFWRKDVLGHLDDAIVVVDGNGLVRDYNAAATDVFPAVTDAVGEPFRTALRDADGQFASDDGTFKLERDGSTEFYRRRSVSLTDGMTTNQGRVLVFADVTEVEHQRRRLQRQTDQFDDFAEATTHELRNAVTLIDGYLDTVADGVVAGRTEADVEALGRATEGVDRMRSVISDLTTLVNYSRPPENEYPCDLRTVIADGFSDAGVDGLSYEVETDSRIVGEERRLTEMFASVFEFAAANGATAVTLAVEAGAIEATTDGSPLSRQARRKAFAYGEPVPSAAAGMTLPNVRMLARSLGWTTAFDESYADGVRLRIEGHTRASDSTPGVSPDDG